MGHRMYRHLSLLLVVLTLLSPQQVYGVNPQLFYKNFLLVDVDPGFEELLREVMIIESNVKTLSGRMDRQMLMAVDILVLGSGDGVDTDLLIEWFNTGGKGLVILGSEGMDRVLRALGSSLRVYSSGPTWESIVFSPPEIPDYEFDETVVGLVFNVSRRMEISILEIGREVYTLEYSSGGVAVAVEYIPVYSDIFTWYYSKVMALGFGSVESGPAEDLYLELLSWLVSIHLQPNPLSLGLTVFIGILMAAVYIGIYWAGRGRFKQVFKDGLSR